MRRKLDLPYAEDDLLAIEPGDEVLLSGTLYVGRDQVHKRLFDAINEGRPLPFDFQGNAIYYMGPSPAPDGFVLGAAGPTTSMRMDPFTPLLADYGLKVIVGKGPRTKPVVEAIGRTGGLYLQAYGGCGALYSSRILQAETVAYPELGPEALLRLTIHDFPVFCLIDSRGREYMR